MDTGAHCGANVFFDAVAGQKSGRRGKGPGNRCFGGLCVNSVLNEQLLAPGGAKTNRFEAFDGLLFTCLLVTVIQNFEPSQSKGGDGQNHWENGGRTQT